jgi:elongation factor G
MKGAEQETPYPPEANPEKELLAHVFKVSVDSFVGRLGIVKVHQGVLRAKSDVLIGDTKKPVRIGHLVKRQGKESAEVEAIGPGDIGAVAKVEDVRYDAVLHASHDLDGVSLRPLPMPRPLFGLAVELKNHADETKFSAAMHKLMAEDPGLVLERIAATKQTVMRGMGELHLRIVLEKLKAQSHIELLTSPPKVAYKETITAKADGHHRHKKQTGGAGQFGEVFLRVEPLPGDHAEGFEFVNEVFGGSIPRQFMPAIEKGCRQVLTDGAIAGYPLTGVRVCVTDGKYHAVDSKEIAFITAGAQGLCRCPAEGPPGAARADCAPRSDGAYERHGRHHRRPLHTARTCAGHRDARRRVRDQGAGAALRTSDLCQPAQEHDRRRGRLLHRIQPR